MTGPDDRDEPDTTSRPPVPDAALLEELSKAFDPTVETTRRPPGTAEAEGPGAAEPGEDASSIADGADARAAGDTGEAPISAASGDVATSSEDVETPTGGGVEADEAEGSATSDDVTVDDASTPSGDDEPTEPDAPLATVLPIGEPRLADRTDEQVDGADVSDGDGDVDGGEPGPRTIRIGSDEELPDAAYLDDELEREPSDEGTVFIDDDDTGDALATQEATGRGIEPRIRQRRIGVRRAAGLRRLRWVILAVAAVVLVIGTLAFLASPVFDIDEVNVTGDQYTDPDELQAVVDDLLGTPVLLADTAAAEDRLEAIPWVESARVNTDFPDSVDIEIRERRPVAAMPGADGGTRVLDREGRILDVIDGQPIALVWIAGPITLDQPAGEFAPAGPSSAAALVTKLTPTVRRRLDSMLVTPDGSDLQLMLRPLTEIDADGDGVRDDEEGDEADDAADADGSTTLPPVAPGSGGPLIEVRFGSSIGDTQQIEKLVRLERVLDDIGTDSVTVIDVSTAEVTIL